MRRTGFTRVGSGSWICGLGLLMASAGPAMATDISIGGLFATGRDGGTVIGGVVRIGDRRPAVVSPPVVVAPPAVVPAPVVLPRPVVVAPPVIVERVWVSTPRVECRQVPVYNACGVLIAYREECVTVPDGHWETITRPAPPPRVIAPMPRPNRPGECGYGTVEVGYGCGSSGSGSRVVAGRGNGHWENGWSNYARQPNWKSVAPRSK